MRQLEHDINDRHTNLICKKFCFTHTHTHIPNLIRTGRLTEFRINQNLEKSFNLPLPTPHSSPSLLILKKWLGKLEPKKIIFSYRKPVFLYKNRKKGGFKKIVIK